MNAIKILTYFYNMGYNKGHEDTVEGNALPCLSVDLTILNQDIVEEILKEFDDNPENFSVFE